jgi:predicted CopG family antitoxin
MRREYGELLAFSAVLNVKLLIFISNSSCSISDVISCLPPKKETGSRIFTQPFKNIAEVMQHIMNLKLVIK